MRTTCFTVRCLQRFRAVRRFCGCAVFAAAVSIGFVNEASGQSLAWAVQAGGSNFDSGAAVAVDAAGHSYITGFFTGAATFGKGTATETTLVSDVTPSVFVAKYDSAGNFLWVRRSNGAEARGEAIGVDADGNSYVAGNFRFGVEFGGITLEENCPGCGDLFLVKYGPSGNVLWARQAGLHFVPDIAHGGFARGVSVDPAGNPHVTGQFGTVTGELGLFVAKWTANGTRLWVSHAVSPGGTSGSASGASISFDSAGDSYVTGNFVGAVRFGAGEPHETLLTAPGNSDLLLAKYDRDGVLQWATRAGGVFTVGASVAVDASGNACVTGHFHGQAVFGPGEPAATTLNAVFVDLFVARYASNGSLLWVKHAPGIGFDEGRAVAADAAGNCYVAGSFQGWITFGADEATEITLSTSAIYAQTFLARYDSGGSFSWARQSDGPHLASANGLALDAAGQAVLAGVFGNVGGDAGNPTSVVFGPGEDGEVVLTTSAGSGTEAFVARFRNDSAGADLSITKSSSSNPVAGTALTYSLTIVNSGPASATGVTVTDFLSPTVTLVSASPSQGSCGGAPAVVCALGTLAPNGSATVTIAVIPEAAGVVTNTATVAGDQPDPIPGNNSATLETTVAPGTPPPAPRPDLVGSWVGVGETCRKQACTVSGTLTIVNQGSADAPGTGKTPAFVTRFYISSTGALDATAMLLDEKSTKSLRAGQQVKMSVSFKFAISMTGRYLVAIVDADDTVNETSEENNLANRLIGQ